MRIDGKRQETARTVACLTVDEVQRSCPPLIADEASEMHRIQFRKDELPPAAEGATTVGPAEKFEAGKELRPLANDEISERVDL